YRVNIFDAFGGDDYDNPNLCESGFVEHVTTEAATPPLCNAVRAQSWSGELPCAVDIFGLATQTYALQVTATDGAVIWPSSDTQSFAYAGEANVFLSSAGCCDVPRSGCKRAGRAILIVRNQSDDSRDMLQWKWLKGPPTTIAEFGNP